MVAALPVRHRLDGIWVWRSGSGLRGAFMARSVVRDQMTWCRLRRCVRGIVVRRAGNRAGGQAGGSGACEGVGPHEVPMALGRRAKAASGVR